MRRKTKNRTVVYLLAIALWANLLSDKVERMLYGPSPINQASAAYSQNDSRPDISLYNVSLGIFEENSPDERFVLTLEDKLNSVPAKDKEIRVFHGEIPPRFTSGKTYWGDEEFLGIGVYDADSIRDLALYSVDASTGKRLSPMEFYDISNITGENDSRGRFVLVRYDQIARASAMEINFSDPNHNYTAYGLIQHENQKTLKSCEISHISSLARGNPF